MAFLLGMSTVANAQETKVVDPEGGHYFIGIKGGAQATLTHYNFTVSRHTSVWHLLR